MEKLNFYIANSDYVNHIKKVEQEKIQHLAERTYKRVILGKDLGLVINSCDFILLEEECKSYIINMASVLA